MNKQFLLATLAVSLISFNAAFPESEGNDSYFVRKSINKGHDINEPGQRGGNTLLITAASFACSKTVKDLLTLGANPFPRNDKGRNALDETIHTEKWFTQVRDRLQRAIRNHEHDESAYILQYVTTVEELSENIAECRAIITMLEKAMKNPKAYYSRRKFHV